MTRKLLKLSLLLALAGSSGCSFLDLPASRSLDEAREPSALLLWNGDVDQVYHVEWTPFFFDQWVDISGPLVFPTTNMSFRIPEGAQRVRTYCRP